MIALVAILAVAALGAAPADARKHKNVGCENAQFQPNQLTEVEALDAVYCLLNKRRDAAGVGPLDYNNKLATASARHTNYMLNRGCFSHECSGEASMTTRIKSTGYLSGAKSWQIGENIAWGEGSLGTPASIVQAWMDSPGHRANILNPSYDDIGIGVAGGRPGKAGHSNAATYTTDFGRTSG